MLRLWPPSYDMPIDKLFSSRGLKQEIDLASAERGVKALLTVQLVLQAAAEQAFFGGDHVLTRRLGAMAALRWKRDSLPTASVEVSARN